MLDYYKLLNIRFNATNDEIKKAYRIAALFWHPDKNKSEQAHQKFIDITEAYNILLDPNKRKVYDELLNEKSKRKTSSVENNYDIKNDNKRKVYEEWIKEERKKAENKLFVSADKLLTDGFHFIDEFGWVLFAIFMIIWFIIFLTYK